MTKFKCYTDSPHIMLKTCGLEKLRRAAVAQNRSYDYSTELQILCTAWVGKLEIAKNSWIWEHNWLREGKGRSVINKLECLSKISTLCFKLDGCLFEMTILYLQKLHHVNEIPHLRYKVNRNSLVTWGEKIDTSVVFSVNRTEHPGQLYCLVFRMSQLKF